MFLIKSLTDSETPSNYGISKEYSPFLTASLISWSVSPSKGITPESRIYKVTPDDQISQDSSNFYSNSSGGI